VLVLVALPAVLHWAGMRSIARPEGVMVSSTILPACPRYREALEGQGKPDAVVELRLAAAEADAVLLVTRNRGQLPSMAHKAIDWLTHRWRRGALHDKPITVVGQSAGSYSGVWSHRSRTRAAA
jgi:NAD(P)H-dependent FMN reductase